MKFLSVAALVATLVTGAAHAATLTGTFNVTVYNYNSDGNSNNSFASPGVLSTIGSRTNVISDSFTYTGALNFGPGAANIGAWLATAGGSVAGLDPTVAGRTLSSGFYQSTSFFVFTASYLDGFNATIRHDDGISVLDDGVLLSPSSPGPTTAINTTVNGFNGGTWSLFYVAANGNPSILNVDANRQPTPTPVPVPAALPLLAMGLGAFAFLRRRAARA